MGRVGSSEILPEIRSYCKAEYLILSKVYPFHGILSHVIRLCRLEMVLGIVSAEKQQSVDP
jgi:hypothetical protein